MNGMNEYSNYKYKRKAIDGRLANLVIYAFYSYKRGKKIQVVRTFTEELFSWKCFQIFQLYIAFL